MPVPKSRRTGSHWPASAPCERRPARHRHSVVPRPSPATPQPTGRPWSISSDPLTYALTTDTERDGEGFDGSTRGPAGSALALGELARTIPRRFECGEQSRAHTVVLQLA